MQHALVVDTSRCGISLGLFDLGIELHWPDARGERLGEALDQLLAQANIGLTEIDRVLVATGPGSFTGLRTGIAFCQGLSMQGQRTLYSASTLALLACHAPVGAMTVVVMRARPGLWYCGVGLAGSALHSEQLLNAEQLQTLLQQPCHLLSDDAELPTTFSLYENANVTLRHLDFSQPLSLAPFMHAFGFAHIGLDCNANYLQGGAHERKDP